MSDPKRLDFTKNAFCDMGCDCGLMPDPVESKDGRFIFWDDYAKLKAENERLTKMIESSQYYFMSIKLTAENDLLRKAGDAMAKTLDWTDGYAVKESLKAENLWNAAKDGKPTE